MVSYAFKKIICPFMKHMLILTVNVAVYALVCKLCTNGPYDLLYFEIKQYNVRQQNMLLWPNIRQLWRSVLISPNVATF